MRNQRLNAVNARFQNYFMLNHIKSFLILGFHNQYYKLGKKDNFMMTSQLSQRLIQLRRMIAEKVESLIILQYTDSLIIFCEELQIHRKDDIIAAKQLQISKLAAKIKKILKQKKILEHSQENLISDLESNSIQCKNLQTKLKEIRIQLARQKKTQVKKLNVKTCQMEVQVETVNQLLVDNLLECYRKEIKQNEALRSQIENIYKDQQEGKDLLLQETTISQISIIEEKEVLDASFLQEQFMQIQKVRQQKVSWIDMLWSKSRQMMTYLDQRFQI